MIDEQIIGLPNVVEDDHGNCWTLDKMLGRGGQGAVFKTKDANIAVKFLVDSENKIVNDEKIYEKYQEKINDVVIIRLNNDVTICRPLHMLKKPMCGYIMHLLSDLKPINELVYNQGEEQFKDFILTKGGLEKKLQVLIELSRLIAKLHSNGLVYSDISLNNIFYSPNANYSKVWLIDCDNLHYSTDYPTVIYTPGYGAPEVVTGTQSNTIFSDCFSFAVVAFKILTSRHPFEQDYDEMSSSDGWDATTKSTVSNVDANNTIWLCDKEHKNYEDNYKEISYFVSKQLLELFDQTFSKTGRLVPNTRPSMRKWYKNLIEVYQKLWKCEDCGNFYFINKEKKCFRCDSDLNIKWYYNTITYLDDNDYNEVNNDYNTINNDEDFKLPNLYKTIGSKSVPIYNNKILYNFDLEDSAINEQPLSILGFSISNNTLIIHNFNNFKLSYITNVDKGTLPIDYKINKGENLIICYKNGTIIKYLNIAYYE